MQTHPLRLKLRAKILFNSMFILNTLAIAIIFIEGLNPLNYHFLERLGLIIIFNNGFFWNSLLATSTSTNINLKAE